jgi:hypothetical protein
MLTKLKVREVSLATTKQFYAFLSSVKENPVYEKAVLDFIISFSTSGKFQERQM